MKSVNNTVCKYASIMLFLNVPGPEHTNLRPRGFGCTGSRHPCLAVLSPTVISFALWSYLCCPHWAVHPQGKEGPCVFCSHHTPGPARGSRSLNICLMSEGMVSCSSRSGNGRVSSCSCYMVIKYFTTILFHGCVRAKSLQLCQTLCDPMDCSPPGSSVHGILQARILEWVAISSSWRSS